MERWLASPLPLLVSDTIIIIKFLPFQVVLGILSSHIIQLVVEFGKKDVLLIPLPNLMVQHHHHFRKIGIVAFPLSESTLERIIYSLIAELISDGEILLKSSDWFVTKLTLNVPLRNTYS